MKEKPILFSTPMVQALLNTKPGVWPAEPVDPDKPYKWMTRRIIKEPVCTDKNGIINIKGFWIIPKLDKGTALLGIAPYNIGDILWVRETFTKTKDGEYIYRSDPMFDGMGKGDFSWNWTSPLFVPHKASRIFLEVKAIKIERIQDISERDAIGEGIPESMTGASDYSRRCFHSLWDTLNAKRGYGWDSNPWVWVCEFMRAR
jgi:hypothetical protein